MKDIYGFLILKKVEIIKKKIDARAYTTSILNDNSTQAIF